MSIHEITYNTGETSELTDASQKQIRYWEGRGYIQSDRNACGLVAYRRFTQSHVQIIRAIKGYLDQDAGSGRGAGLKRRTVG